MLASTRFVPLEDLPPLDWRATNGLPLAIIGINCRSISRPSGGVKQVFTGGYLPTPLVQGVRRWLEQLKLILSPAHNLLIMRCFTRCKDPEYLPFLGIKRLLVSRG